jgi:hypothetical protein
MAVTSIIISVLKERVGTSTRTGTNTAKPQRKSLKKNSYWYLYSTPTCTLLSTVPRSKKHFVLSYRCLVICTTVQNLVLLVPVYCRMYKNINPAVYTVPVL